MPRSESLLMFGALLPLVSAVLLMLGSLIANAEDGGLPNLVFAECGALQPEEARSQIDQQSALAAIQQLGGRVTFDGQSNAIRLDLDGVRISDADLKFVSNLTSLEILNLSHTQVTDAGLQKLKGLTKLYSLTLYDTTVGDAGLEHLKGLPRLRLVMAKKTNVTEAGARQLERILPDCVVSHSPLNPLPSRVSLPVGQWNVQFANGVKQACEFRPDGSASVVEAKRTAGGKISVQGQTFVVAYEDDRIERWTPIGDHMVVEHWVVEAGSLSKSDGARYWLLPSGAPALGIADQVP